MATVVGKDQSRVHRITCGSCASILEYNKAEVQRIDGKDYSGGADGMEYVICPNCGEKAIIRSW